ncbi:MAG: homocysteine S-methyltransferase family protein [Desulfobacteraceae bacterium]|nr:homocysteine S-methyltransferase family protein [Desulfobacteraceae bacterium]
MRNRPALELPRRPVVLDGGMGRELRFRNVPVPETIWSAHALLAAPDTVVEIHRDFIAAGADIITTNTYGVIRADLETEGIAHRFDELNRLACRLAAEAAGGAETSVWIAGSLPPLQGSYRPDRVGSFEEIVPLYREQAALLAPHVDLLLCETMSSAAEARAAAVAACETGRPVWVSWTLHEDRSGRLRSGETIDAAVDALAGLPVTGLLANCCAPESITAAMPMLVRSGASRIGGYANTFLPVPEDWSLDGPGEADGLLALRDDLGPEAYARHAERWLAAGASVVGGCCGTRPSHIARLHALVHPAGENGRKPEPTENANP